MESKRTAYLISCSDHYGHRLFAIDEYLKSAGFATTYVTCDFDHSSKRVFRCPVPGCVQLHARPYQKNLSFDRILSHKNYARDVFRWLETREEPALVVALLPPNYLAKYGAAYKRRHPQVRLIFDLFDLWPETFPFGRMKRLLGVPFHIWAGMRDQNLKYADLVTAECDLFREKLGFSSIRTVYLAARPLTGVSVDYTGTFERLQLCYLGAINNIIDIPGICGFLREAVKYRPVTLHVIGGGERQQELLSGAAAAGAEVVYHGIIYDEAEKHAIMNGCHFGLNFMKSAVCIGLTMKSVDYLKHGLPLLSNIPADTQRLIGERHIGLQVSGDGSEAARQATSMSGQELLLLRENARRAFSELFDLRVICRQYEALLQNLLRETEDKS
ncbi:MAG: glycosyltransferase family 4 protein [Clostridiales bacterium]|nr:glycosyltransferase family 4 protein [Clostridiales bacterium]